MSVVGNAALVFGGVSRPLEAPLRVLRYRRLGRRWQHEATDYSTHVWSLDSAGYEMDGVLSFETDPVALIDLLEDAADSGETVDYLPDADDTTYAFGMVIIPRQSLRAVRDRVMGEALRRWEVELTFRRVGVTSLSPIISPALGLVEDGDDYVFRVTGNPDQWVVTESGEYIVGSETAIADKKLVIDGERIIIRDA